MLSYRALEDWDGLIRLYDDMPKELQRQIMVHEQLAFAINRRAGKLENPAERAAERERALAILHEVEIQQGPSSETCGLIGRIHKDRWQEALERDPLLAGGHLDQAIDAYLRGFKADARDAYPGINAVTLLDVKGDDAALREKDQLLPVVRFAVEQRLAGKSPDYWDYATMLGLAVLGNAADEARHYLARSLTAVRESWEPASTANNLRMIHRARQARGEDTEWLEQILERLVAA
jgi:hypothetical protein